MSNKMTLGCLVAFLVMPYLLGCGGKKKGPDPREEAKKYFLSKCARCHGKTGLGDGSGAAVLKTKPRNYTDKKWQASVTDEFLAKIIVVGGAGVGKSPLMPPNPDLKKKPQVVKELVKIIRGFAK